MHNGCRNARLIMIAMWGTAVTGGLRRRLGGGFMMTKCDEFQLGTLPAAVATHEPTVVWRTSFMKDYLGKYSKPSIWRQTNMPKWFCTWMCTCINSRTYEIPRIIPLIYKVSGECVFSIYSIGAWGAGVALFAVVSQSASVVVCWGRSWVCM